MAEMATSVRPGNCSLPLAMEKGGCRCLSSSHLWLCARLWLGEALVGLLLESEVSLRHRTFCHHAAPASLPARTDCSSCSPCLTCRHVAQLPHAGPPLGSGCRIEATACTWGCVPDTSSTSQAVQGQDPGGLAKEGSHTATSPSLPLSGHSYAGFLLPTQAGQTSLRSPALAISPHQHQAPTPALLCLCPPWSLAAAPALHTTQAHDTMEHRAHTRSPAQDAPGVQRRLRARFGKQHHRQGGRDGGASPGRQCRCFARWFSLPAFEVCKHPEVPAVQVRSGAMWSDMGSPVARTHPLHHTMSHIPQHCGPCPGPQPTAPSVPTHALRHAETKALLALQPSCPRCGWTHGTSQPPGPPRHLALFPL